MAKKKTLFGRWSIKEQRDSGGQAVIYDVEDTTDEFAGPFVLKKLKNAKRVERFRREIAALKTLQGHHRIVEIVDADPEDEPSWFVMAAGDDSLANFRPKQGLPIEDSIRIFREITKGVAALHSKGIIHRDLKPDNIIMVDGAAKVGDLGLCLIEDMPRVTPSWEAVGPRYYMAPELESGRDDDVDIRADVYSLGKIFYWLLTGVALPRERLRERRYALPGRRQNKAIDEFSSVIANAISDSRKMRTKTVEELIAEFDAAVDRFECRCQRTLSLKLADDPISLELIDGLNEDELIELVDRAIAEKVELDTSQVLAVANGLPLSKSDAAFKVLGLLNEAEFQPHLDWAVQHFLNIDDKVASPLVGRSPNDAHRAAILWHALHTGSREVLFKLVKMQIFATPEGAPVFEDVVAKLGAPSDWPPLVFYAATKRLYPGRLEHMRAVIAGCGEDDIERYVLAQEAIAEETGEGDLDSAITSFIEEHKNSLTLKAKLDSEQKSQTDEVNNDDEM